MTESSWEKPKNLEKPKRSERAKFLAAGLIILGAVLYLLVSGTLQGARYFITVADLLADAAYIGQTVRISGAVDGETIDYDSENAVIQFEIANISGQRMTIWRRRCARRCRIKTRPDCASLWKTRPCRTCCSTRRRRF